MARLSTEDRRAQLLATGRAVFAECAYDAVSIEDLATAAGVSKGLLYHYFRDKRGFYLAVLREVALDVEAVTVLSDEVEPLAAVRGSIHEFIRYVMTNEPFYRALVRGGIGSDPEVEAVVERVRRTSVHRVVEALALQPSPIETSLAYGWVGFTEFVVLDWLSRRHLSEEDLTSLVLTSLLRLMESR